MKLRLVLLRGILRDHRHWNDWPQQLAQALPNYVIETPDIAGNGDCCQDKSGTSMAAMVDDLRTKIAPLQSTEKLLLVTLSMGGMIACQWAERYPDEIAGVVMINSSLRRFSPFYHRLQPQVYGSALKVAFAAKSLAREQWVLRWTSLKHHDNDHLARRWDDYASAAKPTLMNSLRQLIAAARYQGPAQAPCANLLILAGAADQLVSPKCSLAMSRAWRCRHLTHPQAGHDLPLDQPRWVVRQVVDFVAAVQRKASLVS
ncbi:alpha/beta hydrolase [Neiella sp. HB171785]|uniref:Alpha/beta hydrolase n=1 Tax=Neiella litorisoli TaxID=2771431 RepID=A0A8J6ULP3_9GAMM|nr:alpha/beta hydrolase [Neiella litorisoli]MBD1389325.1 alpha/beta hydrolase [Neiella litorisoli]